MLNIKFRAWNGVEFYDPVYAMGCWFRNQRNLEDYTPTTDPIMQFTGIKDINGIGIYEGDIVVIAGYGNYQCEFPFLELYEAVMEDDIGKIIGNVHQNPELLNGD